MVSWARLSDLYAKNKAGKVVLSIPSGARVLLPVMVTEHASDLCAAATARGRLLVFPVSELPLLQKGKGLQDHPDIECQAGRARGVCGGGLFRPGGRVARGSCRAATSDAYHQGSRGVCGRSRNARADCCRGDSKTSAALGKKMAGREPGQCRTVLSGEGEEPSCERTYRRWGGILYGIAGDGGPLKRVEKSPNLNTVRPELVLRQLNRWV